MEQVKSPARYSAKNESLATPTKRMSTPVVDAPQKNKKVRQFSLLLNRGFCLPFYFMFLGTPQWK